MPTPRTHAHSGICACPSCPPCTPALRLAASHLPSFARPLGWGGPGLVLRGHSKLLRLPSLPPSPPHPTLSPGCPPSRAGPRGIEGGWVSQDTGVRKSPMCCLHLPPHCAWSPRGTREEIGRRQSHGPPRSPSPTRPSPTSRQPDPSHLPSSLALCETVPCLPHPYQQAYKFLGTGQTGAELGWEKGRMGDNDLGTINISPAGSCPS